MRASQHILGYFRHHQGQNALVLANFSDRQETIAGKQLRWLGMRKILTDLVSGKTVWAVSVIDFRTVSVIDFVVTFS